MLHPVGRLPAQIYWRRRVLLAGIVFVLVLAAGWFFIGGASGDSPSSGSTTASATEPPTGDSALTGLEQVIPSLVPAEATDPSPAGADTGAPAEGADPPADPAAADPGPCPDEAIGLSVGSEFPQYAAGSKPLLGLNVTNISTVACLRDLDAALQVWGLFAPDGTRLWGSSDCFPDASVPAPQLLQPAQVVAFTIIWSGKISEPTCTAPRPVLGPGTYILRGYLGNLVSPDVGLVIT